MKKHITAVLVVAFSATISAAQTAPSREPDWEIMDVVLPERAHSIKHAPPPPSVPDVMQGAPAVTVEMAVRLKGPVGSDFVNETTVRMTRDKGKVHLDYPDRGQAWLFEQNSVDPRRALGMLIDASLSVILDHTEADLTDAGIAQGWVDIGGFGIRPPDEHMTKTDSVRERGGITFTKYVPADMEATNLRELWWSDEYCLPMLVLIDVGGGRTRETEAVRITLEADSSVLRDPSARLRSFQRMDVVDWREKHHGIHAHVPGVPCSSWAAARPRNTEPSPATPSPASSGIDAPDPNRDR